MSTATHHHSHNAGSGLLGLVTRFVLPTIVLLAAVWAVAYTTGIAPWLGTATRTELFNRGVVQREGRTIGVETFPFMRGQRIFVDYDIARVTKGGLAIRVIRNGVLYPDKKGAVLITKPSKGRFEYIVPRSGRYSIVSRCYAKTEGCDIAYTTTWGAHSVFESRGVSASNRP